MSKPLKPVQHRTSVENFCFCLSRISELRLSRFGLGDLPDRFEGGFEAVQAKEWPAMGPCDLKILSIQYINIYIVHIIHYHKHRKFYPFPLSHSSAQMLRCTNWIRGLVKGLVPGRATAAGCGTMSHDDPWPIVMSKPLQEGARHRHTAEDNKLHLHKLRGPRHLSLKLAPNSMVLGESVECVDHQSLL